MTQQSCDNKILESVFSTTEVLYAYLDTDFNFIRVNRAYAQADNREPEFYVGKNHFDLFPHNDNQAVFRRVVETGEPHTAKAKAFEYAEHPERGTTYWDWTLHPVKGESGEVEALVLCLVNVTERKQSEKLIRIQRDLAVELNAVQVLEEGLRICLQAALEASLLDCGGIYLVDEETGALYLVCHRGLSDEFVKHASCFEPESPNTRFVLEGKPVYSQHLKLGVPVDEPLRKEGLEAIAVIPFSYEGRVIGCLNVASHTFDEVPGAARDVLEAIAAQMGGAVSRLYAEEALRESENMYRTLVETSPDAIVMSDLETNVLRANKQAALLAGCDDPEELVGTKGFEFITPEDRERAVKNMMITLETGRVESLEYMLKRKDGSAYSAEISTSVIRDEEEQPKYFMAVLRDITERKKAEQALRESEKRYRTFSENVNDIVWTMDMNMRITSVSASIERNSGYTPEEFMAKGILEMMTAESLESVQKAFQEEMEIESRRDKDLTRTRTMVLEMVVKDGSRTWNEHQMTFARDEEGRPIGIFGVSRDITERRHAELALRQSEASLKAVNDAVGLVLHIMIVDRELHVLEHNKNILDVFGRSVGKKCHQAVKGEETSCEECPAEEVWKDAGIHKLEENWVRPSAGGKGCFRVFAVPMFEPDGRFERVMVVAEDITGLKTSEEARKEVEGKLEEQQVLAIASDRLRSLGEMAAGIAHELNQPLVGVRGLAEHIVLALDRKWELSKDDVYAKLQKIIEQADRMAHIIEHVRMFAREANRPEVCQVNVNQVVNSSLGLVTAQLRQRGLELVSILAEDVPGVEVNPFSLEEVILNLVTNARDAVEERLESDSQANPVVTLRTMVDQRGPEIWVKVEVTDRGVGIPAERLGRVFDPFYTTKEPDKGTGLGLAISKSIIEKFGGTIEIRSEPGGGTTAIISLPAVSRQTEM